MKHKPQCTISFYMSAISRKGLEMRTAGSFRPFKWQITFTHANMNPFQKPERWLHRQLKTNTTPSPYKEPEKESLPLNIHRTPCSQPENSHQCFWRFLPRKLVRNSRHEAPTKLYWIKICSSARFPQELRMHLRGRQRDLESDKWILPGGWHAALPAPRTIPGPQQTLYRYLSGKML